ncbi:protein TAPETUM DETERMINANT 1-like [Cucumis melo var. makuwa]|uniref:Protein TAPETUM DETERMINANT 1-like n=2 Tax=Cucumis melo TaxID=3656 RepID=A0A5D3CMA8_CUCMM|nr:protein TAPETUM DETERMINANT 1-like [Cucumis melo var. makuwa]TYK12675.1 protein TAPETUM DETERMINANT 1-like [Cucumis melo var. makuwa]
MAISVKLLAALLVLSFISTGNCQCVLNNITISQKMTGFQIHGMTEWDVTITNNCICSQSDLKLDCKGFATTLSIDPSILSISDNECLVNNGKPIFNSKPITFKYAQTPKFNFKPISSQISCS